VLRSCMEAGARPAGPGEFTWRAFLSGRIDLTQAEAVAELVAARTKAGARLAVGQLSGRLSDPCQTIVDSALDITAQVEAGVDFPEEELEATEFGRLAADLRAKVIEPLSNLIRQARQGRPLRDGVRVVLAGRPNVGKSSLFNALLGRPRALVFTEPGTTRDYLEEMMELDGLPLILTDTAGLRSLPPDKAEGPETAGMASTLELALEAGLILLVAAADEGFNQADQELPSQEVEERTVLVVNKSDLVSGQEAALLARSLAGRPGVAVSAKTGQGLDDLRATIRAELVKGGLEPEELSCLPNLRQEEALDKARQAFESALKSLDQGRPAELVGVDLREGLDQMGRVTGQTAPEAVLERIFSQFCVGK
ncbi:MAG: 50S ribosome-binding GTPase, partial [Deltaproteobacteria bacterium]|nr:50S ribosome-binding GTPase [Deltaproteobacteria bacterium]